MKNNIKFILLILIPLILAQQSNLETAYSWLFGVPNTDVFGASLKALAFSKVDSSRVQPYLNYINSNKHSSQPCWPNPNCNIKDTAIVLLTETKLGLGSANTESIINWLASRQSLAPLQGSWNLQIVSSNKGQCSLRYQRQGESISNKFSISVDQGKISYGSCKDQYFFDLGSCLGSNILNKPSTTIEVSCQSLQNSLIFLIYKEGSTIYLIDTPISTRAKLTVNNGFFNDKIDTLYTNWALKEAGSNINSLIYLKKNQENKVLDQALLFLSTKDRSYLNKLLALQGNFGEFKDSSGSQSEFANGLAGLALREGGQFATELENLRTWINSRQKQDGSWGSNEKTTAIILYGVFEGITIPSLPAQECLNGKKDANEECDGTDWGSIRGCSDLNFAGGTLVCTINCRFNTTLCTNLGITQCSDRIDNDRDGFCDLVTSTCTDLSIPGDLDCANSSDNSEFSMNLIQCSDHIDNDQDNRIDYPNDPDCASQQDNSEFPDSTICALTTPQWIDQNGAPIALVRGSQSGKPKGETVLVSIQGNAACRNKQIIFNIFEDELGEDQMIGTLGPVPFNVQEGFVFVEWQPVWFDDNLLPQAVGDPEFYFIAKTSDLTIQSTNSSLLHVTMPVTTECSDSIDNDRNGFCDTNQSTCINNTVKPGDPGCSDINDLVENVRALACADGIDNDNDNLIDSLDPGCLEPLNQDNSEVDGLCVPDWMCDPWSICSVGGTQTRICRDLNSCGISCTQGNQTCITTRDCAGGNETGIELPEGGEDTSKKPVTPSNPCIVDGICEPEYGEDEINCPSDCLEKEVSPPSKLPSEEGEEEPIEEEVVEESKSRLWIVAIAVLLILVLIAAYFFIFRKPTPLPKKTRSFEFPSQPSRQELRQMPLDSGIVSTKKIKKSKIEDGLERSLREAKKLLER